MRVSNQIVLASTNRHKFNEFKEILSKYPDLELVEASQIIRNAQGLGHVETFQTYEENALAKARLANNACHYPCLADDSGLEVMALEGKPGIHSHRFAVAKAGQSQDQANLTKLLDELKNITAEQREARFVCSVSLVIEGIHLQAQGVLEGTLVNEPRGNYGFGYDPIFVPKGSQQTLAELPPEEKNSISHRALAVHELMRQAHLDGIMFAKP